MRLGENDPTLSCVWKGKKSAASNCWEYIFFPAAVKWYLEAEEKKSGSLFDVIVEIHSQYKVMRHSKQGWG